MVRDVAPERAPANAERHGGNSDDDDDDVSLLDVVMVVWMLTEVILSKDVECR